MRHLTRDKGRAELLLERARTIAIVGPTTSERNQATINYLRSAGYDVVLVRDGALADVPGAIDLVLVFRAPDTLQEFLEAAAAKKVDGVWFTQQAAGRVASSLARRLGLTVIVEGDIVRLHRDHQRASETLPRLIAVPSRREKMRRA
jgi:uncharacterized protein